MDSITLDLTRDGPYLPVEIELSQACSKARSEEGLQIPEKICGTALLDTGATESHMTTAVLKD